MGDDLGTREEETGPRGCVCLGMDPESSGEALLSALNRPYIPFELQK